MLFALGMIVDTAGVLLLVYSVLSNRPYLLLAILLMLAGGALVVAGAIRLRLRAPQNQGPGIQGP